MEKADRSALIALPLVILVALWAGRLGLFLFRRILKAGKDARFDEIKVSFVRFLGTWTLQGLWVTLTLWFLIEKPWSARPCYVTA